MQKNTREKVRPSLNARYFDIFVRRNGYVSKHSKHRISAIYFNFQLFVQNFFLLLFCHFIMHIVSHHLACDLIIFMKGRTIIHMRLEYTLKRYHYSIATSHQLLCVHSPTPLCSLTTILGLDEEHVVKEREKCKGKCSSKMPCRHIMPECTFGFSSK